MLIASRNGFTVKPKEKWQNPYVTDGLVAMWDGQWNAGPGVHDAAAATWKDLIGSYEMTIDNGGSFGNDCLICNGQCRGAYAANPTFAAPVTVEIVLRLDANPGSWRIVWHQGAWVSDNRLTRCIIGSNTTATYLSAAGGYALLMSPLSAGVKSMSAAYSGNTLTSLKVNGNDFASNQYTTTWFVSDGGNMWSIGGKSSTANTYAIACRVYSMRLYNRALTAEEVTANYAIDKARFGLE